MTYLSEDPTYLAGGLLLLAGGVCDRTESHPAGQVPHSVPQLRWPWHSWWSWSNGYG